MAGMRKFLIGWKRPPKAGTSDGARSLMGWAVWLSPLFLTTLPTAIEAFGFAGHNCAVVEAFSF